MGFVLSDQALVQAVWCPVCANSFIVSAGLHRQCSVGHDENIWPFHLTSSLSISQIKITKHFANPNVFYQPHPTPWHCQVSPSSSVLATWLHIHVKSFLSHELLKELFRLKLLPCSGEIQRLGHSLSYLTSVKVERISMGIGCQLSTSIPYHSPLNGFPVYFSDSFRLKIIFNITWQIMAKNRAVIT